MWSKNSLLFVFVKPKCTVSIIHMHYKCHFLAWSLMLLSLPVFGCVRNFVLIKLQLPMFLKVLHGPTHSSDLSPEQPLHSRPASSGPLQKCPGLLLNAHRMPKEMLEDSDFFQHCESLLFSAVCSWKIAKFGHWWSWQNMFVIFSVFVSVIRWQQIRAISKQGTYQLVAKSRSY